MTPIFLIGMVTPRKEEKLMELAVSTRYNGISEEEIRKAEVLLGLSAHEVNILRRENIYYQKEHANELFLIESMLKKTSPTYHLSSGPVVMDIDLAASLVKGSEEENLAYIYHGQDFYIRHSTLTNYLVEIFIRIARCICSADAETLRDRMTNLLTGKDLPDLMHLDREMRDFIRDTTVRPSACVKSAGKKLIFIREALKTYPGGIQLLYDRWSTHFWFKNSFAEMLLFGYDYPAIPAPEDMFMPPGVSLVWLPDHQMYAYATRSIRVCGSS